MRLNFLFLFLFLAISHAVSATNFSGGIYANTVWTKANSPYIITGDVVVFDSVILTVEPGTEVLVDHGLKIEIRGRIDAMGTASDMIVFKANNMGWQGFRFISNSASSLDNQANFKYCRVSDATYCFDLDAAYRGPYIFRNCIFSNNSRINRDGDLVLFDSCTMVNNTEGISYFNSGIVSNCVFDSNFYGAVSADTLVNCKFTNHTKIAIAGGVYVANCEVYNNEVGVESLFSNYSPVFINNKVKNNKIGINVASFFNDVVNFKGNEICGNSQYNIILYKTNNADLSGNCWCSSDSLDIRSKILDGYTDVTKGLVTFAPFNTNCTPLPTSVKDIAAGSDLNIYPNPVSGTGNITIEIGKKVDRIVLTDISGRKQACSFVQQGGKYSVDLSGRSSGIYFISVFSRSGECTVKKLVVE